MVLRGDADNISVRIREQPEGHTGNLGGGLDHSRSELDGLVERRWYVVYSGEH